MSVDTNTAVRAAATYVAGNIAALRAVMTAYRTMIPAAATSQDVANAIRQEANAYPVRGQYDAVRRVVTVLVQDDTLWAAGFQYGVSTGSVPAGTSSATARQFLASAVGAQVTAPAAAAPTQAAASRPVTVTTTENVVPDSVYDGITGSGAVGNIRLTVEGSPSAVAQFAAEYAERLMTGTDDE